MLQVAFSTGESRFVMSAQTLIEIVPAVPLSPLTTGPSFMKGMLQYRGSPCPVIDLNQLIRQEPSAGAYHTRIMVMTYGTGVIGLMAEQVNETLQIDQDKFKEDPLQEKKFPFLDGWYYGDDQNIQFLDQKKLLIFLEKSLGGCDE